jgi:saccharopine dehydrogenase-like NADP-dependent oxidoreductase
MKKVAVFGGGRIGSLVAQLLSESGEYHVFLLDSNPMVIQQLAYNNKKNVTPLLVNTDNSASVYQLVNDFKIQAFISCLPYYANVTIAKLARGAQVHYFDLTEDTSVTEMIRIISEDALSAFVPQCGAAPGFINIVSNNLAQNFEEIETIKMRVGALPIAPSNILKYSLTWSPEGLINQYGNPCLAIKNGKQVMLEPLEGLESISIEGNIYECFNTSGGIGTMAETYCGRLNDMTYKTIRYPGHCDIMRLLMNDLNLNKKRELLKEIIESSVPNTIEDFVIIYATVTGKKNGIFTESNYIKKVHNQIFLGHHYTAIQLTTASSLCAVVDYVFQQPEKFQGFIRQEDFLFENITNNQFGKIFTI